MYLPVVGGRRPRVRRRTRVDRRLGPEVPDGAAVRSGAAQAGQRRQAGAGDEELLAEERSPRHVGTGTLGLDPDAMEPFPDALPNFSASARSVGITLVPPRISPRICPTSFP